MGVSEVLLCPYRCLEYKMERLPIQLPIGHTKERKQRTSTTDTADRN